MQPIKVIYLFPQIVFCHVMQFTWIRCKLNGIAVFNDGVTLDGQVNVAMARGVETKLRASNSNGNSHLSADEEKDAVCAVVHHNRTVQHRSDHEAVREIADLHGRQRGNVPQVHHAVGQIRERTIVERGLLFLETDVGVLHILRVVGGDKRAHIAHHYASCTTNNIVTFDWLVLLRDWSGRWSRTGFESKLLARRALRAFGLQRVNQILDVLGALLLVVGWEKDGACCQGALQLRDAVSDSIKVGG
jgi:hypothetical protein